MYLVIAEDTSDVSCLRVLIKRLDKERWIEKHREEPIENYIDILVDGKGFAGCGNLLNKGAKFLRDYSKQDKYQKIIICHDRDKYSKEDIYNKVSSKIVSSANLKNKSICIVIPTEEIEAWILADVKAVAQLKTSWIPPEKDKFPQPEEIKKPKEELTKLLGQAKNLKPLYVHAIDNEKVMTYLDLKTVKRKCPSFAELYNFVKPEIKE